MGDYCIVYVVLVLGGWVWYAVCCLKKYCLCFKMHCASNVFIGRMLPLVVHKCMILIVFSALLACVQKCCCVSCNNKENICTDDIQF